MASAQTQLLLQDWKDQTCELWDIKGTKYTILLNSILGFSTYYPIIPKKFKMDELDYYQSYFVTTGKPIYEIHIPEFSIYVDGITNNRIKLCHSAYKKQEEQLQK